MRLIGSTAQSRAKCRASERRVASARCCLAVPCTGHHALTCCMQCVGGSTCAMPVAHPPRHLLGIMTLVCAGDVANTVIDSPGARSCPASCQVHTIWRWSGCFWYWAQPPQQLTTGSTGLVLAILTVCLPKCQMPVGKRTKDHICRPRQ
jgi:hypothetical protein